MSVVELKPRGAVRSEDAYVQLKDYSQLRYGNITPSDVDGFIDFGDKVFVFLELKHATVQLEGGQRLAYVRLCDACEAVDRKSLVIVAHHDCKPDETVPVHDILVSEYRFKGKWIKPRRAITVKQMIDGIKAWIDR